MTKKDYHQAMALMREIFPFEQYAAIETKLEGFMEKLAVVISSPDLSRMQKDELRMQLCSHYAKLKRISQIWGNAGEYTDEQRLMAFNNASLIPSAEEVVDQYLASCRNEAA